MKLRDKADYAIDILRMNKIRFIVMAILFVVIFMLAIVLASVPITIESSGRDVLLAKNKENAQQHIGIHEASYDGPKLKITKKKFREIYEYSKGKYQLNNKIIKARFISPVPTIDTDIFVDIAVGDFSGITDKTEMLEGSRMPNEEDIFGNNVWISEKLFNDFKSLNLVQDLGIGSTITVPFSGWNETVYLNMELAGIIKADNYVIHISKGLELDSTKSDSLGFLINTPEGSYGSIKQAYKNVIAEYTKLVSDIPNSKVKISIYSDMGYLSLSTGASSAIFLPIALLLIIIACFTLVNTIDIIISKNKYYFAMNRAVGINNRQLMSIMLLISAVILIVVIPIAYGISFAGYGVINYLSNTIGNILFGGSIFMNDSSLMHPLISPLVALGIFVVTIGLSALAIGVKLRKFNDRRILSILTYAK